MGAEVQQKRVKSKNKSPKSKVKEIEFTMTGGDAPKVKYYKGDKWVSDKKKKILMETFKNYILSQGKRMLGLAANQVCYLEKSGHGKRLMEPFIAIKNPEGGCNVYINPVISEYVGEPQERQEFPMTHSRNCIVVNRYNKIIATWYNPMGGKRTGVKLEGLLAQAFQHMVDQLNGVEYVLLDYGHIHAGNSNAKRNDLCPCGSKIKTKRCCGVAE